MSRVHIVEGDSNKVQLRISVEITWNPNDAQEVASVGKAVQGILAHASDEQRAKLTNELDDAFDDFKTKRKVAQ